MLLRSAFTLVTISLLSGCTILQWGEDKPTVVEDPNGGPPPAVLQVPPDLTQPVTKNQYLIPKADANCTPATTNEAAKTSSTVSSGSDVEARLQEVQTLRDKGLINEDELQKKRKVILQAL